MNTRTFLRNGAAALVLAAVMATTGCAVFDNPTTMQRICTVAKVGVMLGSAENIRQHPETRPAWQAARDALWQLESSETLDIAVLVAVLNQLPVKEFKTDRGQLIILAGTIVASDYVGNIPVEQVDKVRPLVRALREGLDIGLGTQ